jgi:hypothetical protein
VQIEVEDMAIQLVQRRSGELAEYAEGRQHETIDAESVTVTLPDGAQYAYHSEQGLGGVGFEFGEAGILLIRVQETDRVVCAFGPIGWRSATGARYRAPRPRAF